MAESATTPVAITICMGSSCFSRGNNRSIGVIQSFVESQPSPQCVEISGRLCEGQCKLGPNLCVDGKLYHEVDPVMVLGLLNHHVAARDREG